MKNISEFKNSELVWTQPRALARAFELHAGNEVLATLHWNSSFGSLATAEAAEGRWTFKRTGFFSPRITVRSGNADANLAVFIPNWKSEGSLQFSSGPCFRWVAVGFWRAHWAFTKPGGEHLIDFEPHSSFLKKTATVKVTPEGFGIPELSLLVQMGWYLMLLRSDDDAASAAAVSAAT